MDAWESEDRTHYDACRDLGVLAEFCPPDAELKSKKGKPAQRQLKRERRAHNDKLIKKARLDVLIEKAAELGAARLVPVLSEHTSVRDINGARAQALVIEAAEQCGRMTVPEVAPIASLSAVLDAWPAGRRLMFCDESGAGAPMATALAAEAPGSWAVLIGPEGGFSPAERAAIVARPFAIPVALGPRVLRADTAAIAALTMLQAHLGDWR